MTRQKQAPVPAKSRSKALNDEFKKAHPFQFVNIPLTDEDKSIILESVVSFEQVGDWILRMAYSEGYKVGVSYHNGDQCYIISVTGTLYTREDYNLCVTSRHSDFLTAMTAAMYKHSQYCAHGIEKPAEKGAAGSVFD